MSTIRPVGYNKPLYILPFDHRSSFEKGLYGWSGGLSAEQTERIAKTKDIIFDGFKFALGTGLSKDRAGILVDEQFGARILRDAAENGFITAMPAEKSGEAEFQFEFGSQYGAHIEQFKPTFVKVLVRYNPEDDAAMNRRQAARLKELADYCHSHNFYFMFELLVPATPAQMESVGGDQNRYDLDLRPLLMVAALEQLQNAGVEPDVWKIEGLDRAEDCYKIVDRRAVTAANRSDASFSGAAPMNRRWWSGFVWRPPCRDSLALRWGGPPSGSRWSRGVTARSSARRRSRVLPADIWNGSRCSKKWRRDAGTKRAKGHHGA